MANSRRARLTVAAAMVLMLTGGAGGAGLDAPAQIVFSQNNVPTIVAQNEHDAIFLQGYLHAQNRFFQMDLQRRLFSGTLAELLGTAVLPQDVQLRTLGLRRAAERSLDAISDDALAWLEAYVEGVSTRSVEDLIEAMGALAVLPETAIF